MHITEPKQTTENPVSTHRITERPNLPLLNRAQRRSLAKYIAHKARSQVNVIKRRHHLQNPGAHCPRCSLAFLAPAAIRCQCQVQQIHHCQECHIAFIASHREANICQECAEQIRLQRENEAASASAAQASYYEMRSWDDEQHRLYQDLAEMSEASL